MLKRFLKLFSIFLISQFEIFSLSVSGGVDVVPGLSWPLPLLVLDWTT